MLASEDDELEIVLCLPLGGGEEDKVGRGWDGVACDRVTGRRRRLLTQDSSRNRRQNLDIVGDLLRAV